MPKIKQLSAQEAQKIAAGQVVERPVNILKELIENALDAHAKTVTLYVEDGGKQLIRVVDNGYGMNEEDAQLAFAKHATSKITSVDELNTISTFGFRGEALPSIAAVSKVTLRTKEQNNTEGLEFSITEGTFSDIAPAGCSEGTDITAQELFYNVPARAKFLKKRETELRQITQLINAFCFAHPSVHFNLFSEEKQILKCPPVKTIQDRCTQLWEQKNTENSIAVEQTSTDETIHLIGAISDHQTYRFDRSQIYFFVNKRWVKNFQLANALIKGYNNVIPSGRFPLAALSLTIDPTLVDINIHPKKEEVQFVYPRKVEKLIEDTVRAALENHVSQKIQKKVAFAHPSFATTQHQSSPSFTPQINNAPKPTQSFTPFDFDEFIQEEPPQKPILTNEQKNSTSPNEQNKNIDNTSTYQLIGQFNKTYILIEQEDGLFIIDQHAAHERILYELFKKRFNELPTVNLLFPQIITLSLESIHVLTNSLPLLQKNGIAIELFGNNQLIIKSTPVHIKHIAFDDLVQQIISWIKESPQLEEKELFKTLNEKLHAQMACKAAVKAGDELAQEKMHQLIFDLYKTPNRFSCPHGRPTSWNFTLPELEKKFRRRL